MRNKDGVIGEIVARVAAIPPEKWELVEVTLSSYATFTTFSENGLQVHLQFSTANGGNCIKIGEESFPNCGGNALSSLIQELADRHRETIKILVGHACRVKRVAEKAQHGAEARRLQALLAAF